MTYYKPGDWNAICDSCGFQFKASQLRKRWDGLMVCQADWEPRHPQDFLRVPKEQITPPWTRPDPELDSSTYFACSFFGTRAISGTAVSGCAVAGRTDWG